MLQTHFRRAALFAALVAAAGCTVHDSQSPSLSGPSGLALTLRLNATPDTISQDGGSQSSIRVTAIGPDGRPASGVALRVDMSVGGVVQDYGTLSARTIATGSDGTASVVFTAPPPTPNGSFLNNCGGVPGTCVSIVATASGSNFVTANPESVSVRLVPVGVILPPAGLPVANFSVTPTPVQMNIPATFDASASTPGQNATSLTYSWSFGDGGSGSGKTATHTFTQTGTFNVMLTVTNERGLSASASQAVDVGTSAPPQGDWVFSPIAPVISDQVTFNAAGVRPAAGRTLVSYQWDFNDGTASQSGVITTHAFSAAGTFNVVLTATDDVGQKVVVTKQVPIGTGNPVAVLTVTKAGGTSVNADGNGSTVQPGHTLTYTFLWGDGSADSGLSTPSKGHTYTAAGTYTVTLRVTDDLGRTGSATQAITVP